MRIGELARHTGTSPRLLRYYEQQGLIAAERDANGYRRYDDRHVERVRQIRGLLGSGLSTRVIRELLPCLGMPGRPVRPSVASPAFVRVLEDERDSVSRRLAELTHARDAIENYLARLPRADETA